jgi:hypothetical protein
MLPQPLICVADVQKASSWFQQTLGLAGARGGPEYEQLVSNGQLVLQLHHWDAHEHPHLGNPDSKPYGNGEALWFMSEQIEQDYERAVQSGAEVLEAIAINPLANHLDDDAFVAAMQSAGLPEAYGRTLAELFSAVREGHTAMVSDGVE